MKKITPFAFMIFILAACAPTSAPAVKLSPAQNIIPPTVTAAITPSLTPLPTLTPTPSCTETKGKVISDEYQGKYVTSMVKVLVYLPPCYDSGNEFYPVIYLLHGKPMNETHWVSLGIDKAADTEINATKSKGFIMVIPNIPEPLFCSTDGGPGSYEAEFTKGLLPYIEDSYRVIRSSEARTIAGISRGAIWALEIGFSRPDLFGTVVAFSPALSVNYPRPEYDPFYLADNAKSLPRVLLVAGSTDWARAETVRLAGLLLNKNADYRLEIVDGEHEAKTWISGIQVMFQFLFH